VNQVAQQLELEDCWQYEMAALLANFGSGILAGDTATADKNMFSHAHVAARLLRNIRDGTSSRDH